MISGSWRANWERVPFLNFPPEVRRVIYTTNQIEALNASLRRLLQYRGHFPNDDAVTKILFPALRKTREEVGALDLELERSASSIRCGSSKD